MGKLKTHSEPLPRGTDQLVALFKRVVLLPHVVEIKVTPTEFLVVRDMGEDEDAPVVPKAETQVAVDVDAMLANIYLMELEFDPERHPYIALHNATALLSRDRRVVCGIMAPEGPLMADYFGLPENEMPDTFMGIRVVYHDSEKYPDKIVVVGGPTVYFNDATQGIILDTGV